MEFLNYIYWIWMGCSGFNLLIFLIFLNDYKKLTENSINNMKNINYEIETRNFILVISICSILFGSFATFVILNNFITTGKPFSVGNEE